MTRKLIIIAMFTHVLQPANVQVAMYMPPMYAIPPPIAVAIQMPDTVKTTTTTTTTTESPNFAIAVPVPVPMPVQFAVPALPPPVFCQGQPRPKSCPPCPPCVCMPSCTPAFFSYCSPCHLKCRCGPGQAPAPMPPNPPYPVPGPAYPLPVPVPAPVMGPSPVVVIPLPPQKQLPPPSSSDYSDDSCENDSSTDSELIICRRKYKGLRDGKRRSGLYRRRNAGSVSKGSDTDFVKPILSYVSQNGDVKFETKLSHKEARDILDKRIESGEETVNVVANENSVVVSNNGRKLGRSYSRVLLRDSPTNNVLKEGKNEMVFKSPRNKKINNVAVSFKVS